MFSANPSQRTIKLGEFRSEYELTECQERFEDAMRTLIETTDIQGLQMHINRSPNIKKVEDEENPTLVQLYAKVIWPQQGQSRGSVMELQNVLDDFNTIKSRYTGL